jgi:aminopeptidase N
MIWLFNHSRRADLLRSYYRSVSGLSVTALLCATLFLGCQSASKKDGASGANKSSQSEGSDLLRSEAQLRKERLENVTYDLSVTLPESEENFTGTTTIEFDLKGIDKPLRVDFFEGSVQKITLNGKEVSPAIKNTYWIELPASGLKLGHNQVKIDFTQSYSHQGQGLHKFTDPQTKETFLYTHFEAFDANRFMPCFDQPDLRSRLTLNVNAPATWQVISTTRETSAKPAEMGRKLWSFPQTEPIATYLFSLHAGPYKVWTDKFENIPLRLFARPSMAKYVRVKEWFTITKQGLKFFNNYFGMKYPFKKYDQLAVPEFNAGAMENVAAVTFSERYLERGQVTREQRRGLAGTILHEMAHMWFGDIVTMKWWNDLWLNESFATFMADLSLSEATEFKEAWQSFFARDKKWAYWEDGLITTHPIEADIPSVKVAFGNFDGITYGKGAAVLKQLRVYITPESFQKGVQEYFKKNAFKNTELKDFIGALQTQTNRDLNLWAARWLRQSGTDRIAASWQCSGKTLTQIDLETTPSAGAAFRPQAIDIAVFSGTGGQLGKAQTVHVDLTEARQSVKGNWSCPSFVYPNYGDNGYLAVRLDPKSLQFAKENLGKFKSDLLLRTMVWDDLWQMVRHTEMPLKDYVTILEKHFPAEDNEILLSQIVNTVTGRGGEEGTVIYYWPKDEKAQAEKAAFIAKMEAQYLKRMRAAAPGSDEQKFWFDGYVKVARSPAAIDQIAKWANGANVAPGFPLDVDRQWQLARQLNRYKRSNEAAKAVEDLKRKDTSDRGHRQALAVEAVQPDLAVKQKWVTILKQPKPKVSYAEARSVLGALFPVEQKDMMKKFSKDYFDYLNANGKSENEIFVEHIAESLAPVNCDGQESKALKNFVNESTMLSPSVRKTLRIVIDEDERCQRVRAESKL